MERISVLTALTLLPEHEREALMLTAWDGLRSHEAAAAAGCSTATFTVRVHRGRRRLAAMLRQIDEAAYVEGSAIEARERLHVSLREDSP